MNFNLKEYLARTYMQQYKEAQADGHNAIAAKQRALKAAAKIATDDLGHAISEKDINTAVQAVLGSAKK